MTWTSHASSPRLHITVWVIPVNQVTIKHSLPQPLKPTGDWSDKDKIPRDFLAHREKCQCECGWWPFRKETTINISVWVTLRYKSTVESESESVVINQESQLLNVRMFSLTSSRTLLRDALRGCQTTTHEQSWDDSLWTFQNKVRVFCEWIHKSRVLKCIIWWNLL